ncbi:MAG: protein kinase [Rhodocyclaceae bacterium]|nr:protein kinase [Rhodocyclaceae bacterium]
MDDTPQNLSLMSDLLEPHYNVKLAPSGARALKIVAATPLDLIMLDIMMPEMDGYEVCRQLKENPQTRHIPVIFLTAMDRMEDEEKGLVLGAVDYVTKPISPSILLARVRNQLSLKVATDQLQLQNAQLAEEKKNANNLLHRVKEIADKLLAQNRQMKQEQVRSRTLLQMLGESVQEAGQLERIWEKLRQFPADAALLEDLYSLALEFERKGLQEKMQSVLRYIAECDAGFRDVAQRLAMAGETPAAAEALPAEIQSTGELLTLGRYQIHKPLGKGAMGVVYLGSDPVIGRVVAIKTLSLTEQSTGEDPGDFKERFFREAESAGSLAHPNIVAIFDVGEEQGLAWIAMELLKGEDLAAWSRPGNLLPRDTVLSIIEQVAGALAYAHEKGIVHRDIKPANIVYQPETGSVKVADFGIASITGSTRSSRSDEGLLLGTPTYMSPEQVAGAVVDGRSDLYSLGVTLYLMLAGRAPFHADSLEALMSCIREMPPEDIRHHVLELPDCIVSILAKVLDKNPAQRYQTGAEMAAAIGLCRRSMKVFA